MYNKDSIVSSQRPTLGLILPKEAKNTEDNTFSLYSESEPIATEHVQNRPSKKLTCEDDEDLIKQDTLNACLGLDVFGISEVEKQSKVADEEEKKPQKLSSLVTKVPEAEDTGEVDLHKQHFEHTLKALAFIRNYLTLVPES